MRTDAKVYILTRKNDSALLSVNGSLKNLLERIVAQSKKVEAPERTDILNHLRVGMEVPIVIDKRDYTLSARKLEILDTF